MSNSFSDFNGLINYVEDNLFTEIDVEYLARMAKLSVYEFRRIFSFVVGTPIYEYIRKRRLSSCLKMIIDGEEIGIVSSKCGYDNLSSFSRAFKDFYGFSPSDITLKDQKLRSFTKAGLDVVVKGGNDIEYAIVSLDNFYVEGISGKSSITDTECCEGVWQKFDAKLFREENPLIEQIYAVYNNDKNSVDCCIGKMANSSKTGIFVPKSRWVRFQCKQFDDEYVNAFYKNVLYDFFSSNGYVRNDKMPNLEVFPVDMDGDFVWDIYIPIL